MTSSDLETCAHCDYGNSQANQTGAYDIIHQTVCFRHLTVDNAAFLLHQLKVALNVSFYLSFRESSKIFAHNM